MHFKTVKSILSQNNGINLFRGCEHGCIYCDSRSKCYRIDHDFDDIEVKENAIELLEQALKRKKQKEMIGTGSMTDPYTISEKKLELTKRTLEIIEKHGFGVAILTKSNLILRDIDILERINIKAKTVVQVTLTTFDDELCRKLEEKVCPTSERLKILEEMQKRDIPTVVWLCPILPFINDTEENLMQILQACKKYGVKGIINFGFGLTLREGNREYFYQKLEKNFPGQGLFTTYNKYFRDAYACNSPHNDKLQKIFHQFCAENKIMHNNDEIFKYLATFPQEKIKSDFLEFDF